MNVRMSLGSNAHRSKLTFIVSLAALLAVLVAAPSTAVTSGTSITYTTAEDFEEGQLVNLDASGDTLRLRTTAGTFPSIWIALSDRGTIARVDTRTGEIIGEYLTAPEGIGRNPSRTTVGLDGSAWAGNRNSGYVVHVGLEDASQCVDRNGDGVITTSSGYGDVLPWPSGGVEDAVDECILHLVKPEGGDARHVSMNADGNLWVASIFGAGVNRVFSLVNGRTGAIVEEHGPFGCGGYGGMVDGNGVVWSASSGSLLLRWDPSEPTSASNPACLPIENYGLALAPDGHVWVSELSGGRIHKVAPDGTLVGTFSYGSSSAQGLAVAPDGDVWVSSSLFCSSDCVVSRLSGDGTLLGTVPTPTGAGSTGIAVDAAGKVWAAAINSSTAVRIDPTLGAVGAVDLTVEFPATEGRPAARPYNYSDMTGSVLLGATAPQGTWTVVQDAGVEGTAWGSVSWNDELEGFVPDGASIVVEFRVADTEAGLGGQEFQVIGLCDDLDDFVGRFAQVRITMRPNADGEGPVLSDVTVRTAAERDALGCAGVGAATDGLYPPVLEELYPPVPDVIADLEEAQPATPVTAKPDFTG